MARMFKCRTCGELVAWNKEFFAFVEKQSNGIEWVNMSKEDKQYFGKLAANRGLTPTLNANGSAHSCDEAEKKYNGQQVIRPYNFACPHCGKPIDVLLQVPKED